MTYAGTQFECLYLIGRTRESHPLHLSRRYITTFSLSEHTISQYTFAPAAARRMSLAHQILEGRLELAELKRKIEGMDRELSLPFQTELNLIEGEVLTIDPDVRKLHRIDRMKSVLANHQELETCTKLVALKITNNDTAMAQDLCSVVRKFLIHSVSQFIRDYDGDLNSTDRANLVQQYHSLADSSSSSSTNKELTVVDMGTMIEFTTDLIVWASSTYLLQIAEDNVLSSSNKLMIDDVDKVIEFTTGVLLSWTSNAVWQQYTNNMDPSPHLGTVLDLTADILAWTSNTMETIIQNQPDVLPRVQSLGIMLDFATDMLCVVANS